MRNKDYAPVGATCPEIDSVIAFIDSIDCEDISVSSIKATINLLENIRNANDLLRGWGNGLYEENEILEEKIGELENSISELKDELLEIKDNAKVHQNISRPF
jgi:predicted RNase H-like nuclease (RuvC/YqgF family)